MSNDPTDVQSAALKELGLSDPDIEAFMQGRILAYSLPTQSEPGIAIIQKMATRLRSGIYIINDPGGGLKTFGRFRRRSHSVAKLFGLYELELFGAAVTNEKLEATLLRQGFISRDIVCPDELGDDGNVVVLSRVYRIR
jgi:hypothetical protein